MTDPREHWEKVYTTKGASEVSWFQSKPALSLELIRAAAPDRAAGIIDVGGGSSSLVDALLADDYRDLAVLDVSAAALEASKTRLGARAGEVKWIVADITTWTPERTWNVWHDRAVFHFLTDRPLQDAYVAALRRATAPGACAILSTFALDGPETCSGLPVQRYSPETLAARIGTDFELVDQRAERHVTPWGAEQSFAYAVLLRR